MKEDIKYPAILKSECNRQVVVAYKEGSAYHIEGEFKGEYSKAYSTCGAKNITREYLTNTYGKVESKEHAEFIVELAKNAGFNCTNKYDSHSSFAFYPSGNFSLHKLESVALCSDGMKLITIPLPSKEVEEMKNNGDNLVLGCEELKCEEWPQVGDKVAAYDIGFEREMTMIYRGKNKNNARIVEFENGNVILLGFEGKIKKPKTPEEELRDELINVFESSLDGGHFVGNLLSKFIVITKKPQ